MTAGLEPIVARHLERRRGLAALAQSQRHQLLGALPAYLKGHSQGEYVFDHNWADAYTRAGGRYYPKLQIAAPFTPATGPRVLVKDAAYAAPLLRAAEQLCAQNGFSGAHATFVEPAQVPLFAAAGWLLRHDIQFHWTNHGYARFDDFLAELRPTMVEPIPAAIE